MGEGARHAARRRQVLGLRPHPLLRQVQPTRLVALLVWLRVRPVRACVRMWNAALSRAVVCRSNAKQVADWYVLRMGFEKVAYRGLETGSRDVVTWVVRQGTATLAFSSQLNPVEGAVGREVAIKGDFAKDVAFAVDDARGVYKVREWAAVRVRRAA